MKSFLPLKWSRGAVLIGLAAMLLVAVLYSRGVRRIALGDQFQYIPRESEMVIAIGDFDRIWKGAEQYFGTLLKPDGPLKDVGIRVADLSLPVLSLGTLANNGVDVHRGILIAVYRPTSAAEVNFVAVVPVSEPAKLLQFLREHDESPLKGAIVDARRKAKHEVHHFSDLSLFVAFPEPKVAVISSSGDLLQRSLTLRAENMAHAANNDSLYHAVRNVSRGPLFVEPSIFVHWQGRTAPFDERAGIVRFSPDEVRIEGELELRGGTMQVINALRRRSRMDERWSNRLPDQTMALAVVQDEQLEHYGNFLGEDLHAEMPQLWEDTIGRWAPGTKLPHVDRIAVAMTDVEDGIPDFMVGLWGDQKELEAQLPLFQRELRRARDLVLLQGAVAKYRSERKQAPPPTITDLQRLQLLSPEEDSLFHRYPIGDQVGEPVFRDSDFATPTYERTSHGHRIRFLAPPLGSNDLRYRPDLAQANPSDVRSDRYRMATVFDRGALWIASDVRDLETFLGRDENAPQSRDRVLPPMAEGAKLFLAVAIDRFVEAALLSPGSALEKEVKELDIQDLSSFELDAVPYVDESRLHFSATLRRRNR